MHLHSEGNGNSKKEKLHIFRQMSGILTSKLSKYTKSWKESTTHNSKLLPFIRYFKWGKSCHQTLNQEKNRLSSRWWSKQSEQNRRQQGQFSHCIFKQLDRKGRPKVTAHHIIRLLLLLLLLLSQCHAIFCKAVNFLQFFCLPFFPVLAPTALILRLRLFVPKAINRCGTKAKTKKSKKINNKVTKARL